MKVRVVLASSLLLLVVLGTFAGLAAWRHHKDQAEAAATAAMPEPSESVVLASASELPFQRSVTAIGTVIALQSVTLRNEMSGTVRDVKLVSGQVVEAGDLLVALDVSVEEAELGVAKAQEALAMSMLERLTRANASRAASEMEVDRARADRDVARAQIARAEAIIARKTIRAPFRARVGLADVHPGQYLAEGTELTTLQGVDDAVFVDFSVAQPVLAGLEVGAKVGIAMGESGPTMQGEVVARDARIDRATRNGWVRARLTGVGDKLAPGASVRVQVPVGDTRRVVAVPVSALRRGPAGDHIFVAAVDPNGALRAHLRPVRSGEVLGDQVVIDAGVKPGEQVATSGSFKLREGLLLVLAASPPAAPH